ncbi:hypothetical protein KSP40_PGU018411 [Platanthera guangdongensis]|uniref:Uncharacterized protein n=1 Tax=Platanthera guangdongensis TaxID=2320717 RepID=A0ABR2LXY3_9ASPA
MLPERCFFVVPPFNGLVRGWQRDHSLSVKLLEESVACEPLNFLLQTYALLRVVPVPSVKVTILGLVPLASGKRLVPPKLWVVLEGVQDLCKRGAELGKVLLPPACEVPLGCRSRLPDIGLRFFSFLFTWSPSSCRGRALPGAAPPTGGAPRALLWRVARATLLSDQCPKGNDA